MSERKLMTKYTPKDFDPAAIPKVSMQRGGDERIRLMLPMQCQCLKCKKILFPGKKFNGTKRTTKEKYAGKVVIFTLHFRCSGCSNEIVFKTDPKNRGYELVSGATRMADQYTIANNARKAEADAKDGIVEFKSNVDLIEERAYASHQHMTELEALEEQYDEARQNRQVDLDKLTSAHLAGEERSELDQTTEGLSKAELEQLDEDEFVKLQQQMENLVTTGYWDDLIVSDSDEDDDEVELSPQQSPRQPTTSTTTVNPIPNSHASTNIFAEMNKSSNPFGLAKKRVVPPSQHHCDEIEADPVKKSRSHDPIIDSHSDQLVQLPLTLVQASSGPIDLGIDDYSDSD